MGLSRILYGAGLRLYRSAIEVAALTRPKARKWISGRRQQQLPRKPPGRVIWFHAASLGEFEQGRPVMEAFQRVHPEVSLIVSFFSPSGYEQQKNYPVADAVLYLPLDTPAQARAWVTHLQPTLAVFIKYEVWPNLLSACQAQGVKTLLMAARFYPGQRYFKWWGGLFRKALASFDHIILQEKQMAAPLLHSIGIQHYSYAPDTRIDRVVTIRGEEWSHPLLEQLHGKKVVVAGSIWEKDLRMLMPAINKWPDITWILVPHDLTPANLSRLYKFITEPSHRLSSADKVNDRIIWADTMGMLARLYRYGQVAYVGGGFGQGIHNLLEPTAYGLPTAFGPRHTTFHEATSLIQQGAARCLETPADAIQWLDQYLFDQAAYQRAKSAALAYIEANRGGTTQIVDVLQSLWPK